MFLLRKLYDKGRRIFNAIDRNNIFYDLVALFATKTRDASSELSKSPKTNHEPFRRSLRGDNREWDVPVLH